MFKALIIEDEIQASDLLKNIISEFLHDKIEVVDTAQSVEDGISKFNQSIVSLLFLDINIKGGNAFDVLKEINTENTAIIFLTAHENYAIKAMSVNTFFIDYLLKPYDINKIIESVDRLEKRLAYINKMHNPKLLLNLKNESKVIHIKNIMCILADDRYSVIYTTYGNIRVAQTLKDQEKKLMLFKNFLRLGRSVIINTFWIKSFDLKSNTVLFNNGEIVELKEKDIKELAEILESKLS